MTDTRFRDSRCVDHESLQSTRQHFGDVFVHRRAPMVSQHSSVVSHLLASLAGRVRCRTEIARSQQLRVAWSMLRARTSLLTVSRETNLENMSGGRMVAGAVVLCGWWTQRTAASLLHALSVWKDSALHFRELDRVAVQELRLGVRHFGEVCEAPRGCTIARVVLEPECSLHSRGARAVSRSRCDLQAQRSVQQTLAAGSKLLLKSVRAVRSRIEAHALEALVCHAQCSQSPRARKPHSTPLLVADDRGHFESRDGGSSPPPRAIPVFPVSTVVLGASETHSTKFGFGAFGGMSDPLVPVKLSRVSCSSESDFCGIVDGRAQSPAVSRPLRTQHSSPLLLDHSRCDWYPGQRGPVGPQLPALLDLPPDTDAEWPDSPRSFSASDPYTTIDTVKVEAVTDFDGRTFQGFHTRP
mmetsp:Transcript_58682/g.128576  ORF Transcript_58682/g.128576 Transcript_58682/m.128576 type:complete len:412 (+) Transcript_58682:105-1340(+)